MGQSKMVGDGGGQRDGLVPDSVPEAKPTLPPCTRLHEPVNASTDTCQMLDVSPPLESRPDIPLIHGAHGGKCTTDRAPMAGPVGEAQSPKWPRKGPNSSLSPRGLPQRKEVSQTK